MDIIFSPFGELPDDEWKSAIAKKIAAYESKLASYSGPAVEYRVRETSHGRGADLVTITVSLISLGGAAFFGIPAAHKKVREALACNSTFKKGNAFMDGDGEALLSIARHERTPLQFLHSSHSAP